MKLHCRHDRYPGGWKQLRPCPPPHFAVQWRPGIHQLDFPCLLATSSKPGCVPLDGVKGTLHRQSQASKIPSASATLHFPAFAERRWLNFTKITETSFEQGRCMSDMGIVLMHLHPRSAPSNYDWHKFVKLYNRRHWDICLKNWPVKIHQNRFDFDFDFDYRESTIIKNIILR